MDDAEEAFDMPEEKNHEDSEVMKLRSNLKSSNDLGGLLAMELKSVVDELRDAKMRLTRYKAVIAQMKATL